MGGAQVAAVDDNSAAWSDPAALASLKGWSVQLLGGATAQNRNNLVGTLTNLGQLPWDEIAGGDRPDLVPVVVAGIAAPRATRYERHLLGRRRAWSRPTRASRSRSATCRTPGSTRSSTSSTSSRAAAPTTASRTTPRASTSPASRPARRGWRTATAFSDGVLEVGGAVRYVSGVTYFGRCGVVDGTCTGQDLSELIHDAFQENARTTNKFAFDAAVRANLGIVKVGLVGTALNQPTFTVADVQRQPGHRTAAPAGPRRRRGGRAFLPDAWRSTATSSGATRSRRGSRVSSSRSASKAGSRSSPSGWARRTTSPRPIRPGAYTAGVGFGIPVLSVDVGGRSGGRPAASTTRTRTARCWAARPSVSCTSSVPPQLLFEVLARDPASSARRGRLSTNHADIETPCFMPVGTRGAVKGVAFDRLEAWDCRVVLANTYHLMARPGFALIERAGGLHAFMGWPRAILTDSGGFQVMSLSARRRITEEGVEFRAPEDGTKHFLTPERAMELQSGFGVDVAMALDVCPPFPAERSEVEEACRLTLEWAERSKKAVRGGRGCSSASCREARTRTCGAARPGR